MNRITRRQGAVGALVWLTMIGATLARVTGPDAGPTGPAPCGIERTGMFNPCATLDTTQVQDRRNPECVWQGAGWAAVPCHYRSATLDTTVERQPEM